MSGPLFPLYQEVPEIVLIFICQINSLILNLKITYWMTCLHCHCTCDTYKLHNAKLHVLVTVNTKFIQCMLKHISEKFNELDSFLKTMYLYLLHFKNPKQTNYHPWGLVQNFFCFKKPTVQLSPMERDVWPLMIKIIINLNHILPKDTRTWCDIWIFKHWSWVSRWGFKCEH